MKYVLGFHGVYYFLTGVWPLLHMDSFQRVSGPKTDLWLVKTVGALLAVSGAVYVFSALHGEGAQIAGLMAAGQAFVLVCIDIHYVRKKTIWKIYLADAAVEIALMCSWIYFFGIREKNAF